MKVVMAIIFALIMIFMAYSMYVGLIKMVSCK